MKVLISHFGIGRKGGWGRTYMLAKGLSKLGQQVTLITSIKSKRLFIPKIEVNEDLTIISFPFLFGQSLVSMGFGGLSLILKIIYTSLTRFDIVHSDAGHRPQSGWPAKWNRFLYKSKYIAEWWDFFGEGGQYEKKSRLFKFFLGKYERWSEVSDKINADGVITLSEFMKSRALKLGVSANKVTIIHGGSNIQDIVYVENNTTLKRDYGIPASSLTFGYIGMTEGDLEDVNPFIQAYNQLKNELEINWFTVGKKLSPETKRKYNIGDNFYEFGWIDFFSNSRILGCADAFFLLKELNATNISGWPNKLGDYLACGRPVLMNLYGDVERFIKKSNGSFYITDRSVEDITNKIRLLYMNKESLLIEGRKNRMLAEKNLNWSIKSKELLHFYERIQHS